MPPEGSRRAKLDQNERRMREYGGAENAVVARRMAMEGLGRTKLAERAADRGGTFTIVHATATGSAERGPSKISAVRRAHSLRGARRRRARDEPSSTRTSAGLREHTEVHATMTGNAECGSLKTTATRKAQPLRSAQRRRARDELSSIRTSGSSRGTSKRTRPGWGAPSTAPH